MTSPMNGAIMPKTMIPTTESIGAFVFGLLLTVAYWPGVSGAATTPRWDVAALLAIVLFAAPRVQLIAAHIVGIALVGWLLLTLIWSEGRLDGVDAAFKLIIIAVAFAVGSLALDLRPLFAGAAVGVTVSSGIALAQIYGWHGLPSYGVASGLFFNPDRMASAAAIVFVGAVALRLWWFVPGLLPALVLPQSRAALLAVAVAIALMAWNKTGFRWALLLLGGIAVAAYAFVHRGIDGGVTERLALWQDTIGALTWSGHGLGSFWTTFPSHAFHFGSSLLSSRPDHPHNEWLWLAYEGGIVAVALFTALSILCWRSSDMQVRCVLIALFVLSLFAMPFHDPATAVLGSLVAGHLVGRGALLRRDAVGGGMALRARLGNTRYESKPRGA